MSGDLALVRRKLFWAQHHLDLVDREVGAFVESQEDPFTHHFDAEEQLYVFTVGKLQEVPTRWGLMIGDFISNARSSLDHLVWQLVLANGREPGRHNAFPVYDTEQGWLDGVENRTPRRGPSPLLGVSDTAWAKIKALQPYHAGSREAAGDTWLAALHTLWNIDKHQVVHTSYAYATGDPPDVSVEPSDAVTIQQLGIRRAHLVEGAEVLKVRLLVDDKKLGDREVDMNLNCPLSVAFGELGKGVASLGFLTHVMKQLHVTVAAFEDEFP